MLAHQVDKARELGLDVLRIRLANSHVEQCSRVSHRG